MNSTTVLSKLHEESSIVHEASEVNLLLGESESFEDNNGYVRSVNRPSVCGYDLIDRLPNYHQVIVNIQFELVQIKR